MRRFSRYEANELGPLTKRHNVQARLMNNQRKPGCEGANDGIWSKNFHDRCADIPGDPTAVK